MMILWVILTLMVTLTAVLVTSSLLAPAERGDDAGGGAGVYREQIAEIDRELAEGTIDIPRADAAKLEIKRRVLVLRSADEAPVRTLAVIERKFIAGVAAASIALGATILYAVNGNPEIPASPRVAASGAPGLAPPPHPVVQAERPGPAPETTAVVAPGGSGLASVDDMIGRLAQRLDKAPGDADGWRMLGWSYMRTDRYADAAGAYAKASALQPASAALKTAWAEALVRAAEGNVSAEALRIAEAALAIDANDPRARYFVGRAKEQAGDARGAIEAWIGVLEGATPADDWAGEVRQQTVELARASGIDIATRLPPASAPLGAASAPAADGLPKLDPIAAFGIGAAKAPPPPATGPAVTASRPARGPTAADMKAAESLTVDERDRMVRGMVDGLQARLDANPRDADGWIRVIQSRAVLGEIDKAKAALQRAKEVFGDARTEQARIMAAAAQAGVVP